MTVLAVIALCAGCYLIGSIPFGYIAGRLKGIDVRTAGSGNIGATNVSRLLGRKWGMSVFALDVLKGLAPTVVVGVLLSRYGHSWGLVGAGRNVAWLGAGICTVLGHNYPLTLGFRGGKGVATSLGVVLGVYPYLTYAGLLALVVWVIVTAATRYVSAGSLAAAAAFPLLFLICALWDGYAALRQGLPLFVFTLLVSALVVYRHRENIARIRAGTEHRIGHKRPA